MRLLLFLILPTLTLAFIQVTFRGIIEEGRVITRSGGLINPHMFDEHVITEKGIESFEIVDEDLKVAIEKINGKKPDEVFITSSTPYGDLHKKNGWKQVHVKIDPLMDRTFIDFSSDKITLSEDYTEHINTDPKPKDIHFFQDARHTNMIYSYWVHAQQIKGHDLNVIIDYNIEGLPTYFNETFSFGEDRIYKQERQYESDIVLHLQPRQKVKTVLEAKKGNIKVDIGYKVSLTGDVVAKYNETYKDKHFFKFDIKDIIKAHDYMNQWVIFETLYDIKFRVIPVEG